MYYRFLLPDILITTTFRAISTPLMQSSYCLLFRLNVNIALPWSGMVVWAWGRHKSCCTSWCPLQPVVLSTFCWASLLPSSVPSSRWPCPRYQVSLHVDLFPAEEINRGGTCICCSCSSGPSKGVKDALYVVRDVEREGNLIGHHGHWLLAIKWLALPSYSQRTRIDPWTCPVGYNEF